MKPEELIAQIDKLLEVYGALRRQALYDDLSDLKNETEAFVVRLRAALDRLVLSSSSYVREMAKVETERPPHRIRVYIGILRALRDDINDGWVVGVAELLHADTFSDFLDQATELLNKGYKDPAAVIAGSVLEMHLRLLGTKHGLATQSPSGQPKKADTLNADLVKVEAYGTIEQKSVAAWLGIRNAAAHGHYDKYDHRQVAFVIDAVRDFVGRYPA